jgi:hypothetical protein
LKFAFLQPSVDTEKSGLVDLLWFDESVDPVFLPFLQCLYNVLLIEQVLFVFGEILGAYVFNLI